MNSLWIILACGVACAYAQPTCDETELKKCEDMRPFSDGFSMFPSDPVVLQKKCGQVIPTSNCFVEVVERCPGIVSRTVKEYFLGVKDLLSKVCNQGYIQTIVLKNGKCLNDIMTTKQSVCQARASQEAIEGSCQYFKSIESCLNAFVRNTCGGQAVAIFKEIFRVVMLEEGACQKN